MKNIISIFMVVLMAAGLALPVAAYEPPPVGGYMYEGKLKIQCTTDNVKGEIETVDAYVDVDTDYERVYIKFLQNGAIRLITILYDTYYGGTNAYLDNNWNKAYSTTIAYKDVADKITVHGAIKNKDGKTAIEILSSDLREVFFPEYATYQSQDKKVTFTHKSSYSVVTVINSNGKPKTYRFSGINYSFSSTSKSPPPNMMLAYYNSTPYVDSWEDDGYCAYATYLKEKDAIQFEADDLGINKTLYRVADPKAIFTEAKAVELFDKAVKKANSPQDSVSIIAKDFTRADKAAFQKLAAITSENKIAVDVRFAQVNENGETAVTYVNPALIQENLILSTYIGSRATENYAARRYGLHEKHGEKVCAISNKSNIKNLPLRITLNLPGNYTLDKTGNRLFHNPIVYKYNAATKAITRVANPNVQIDKEKLTVSFDIVTGEDYIFCYKA